MDLKPLKLTKRRLEILDRMQIHSLEDLLKNYPFRYESVEITPFDQWKEKDSVAFEGLIASEPVVIRLSGQRTMTKFKVISWNEEIQVTLFNRPWPGQFPFGKNITVFGIYQGNRKVSASNYNFRPLQEQLGVRPVYSLIKDARQSDMQGIMKKALPFAETLPELIPERFLKKYRLLPRAQALYWIHQPPDEKSLHQAIRRLKYEEFLLFQLSLQLQQSHIVHKEPKTFDHHLIQEKIDTLPYTLTADQSKTLQEILQDMNSDIQMVRLVQGDVGCGKTAIAALAIYACSLSGWQAAFLAPTEILARQHLENLKKMGIDALLLASSLPAKEKRQVLESLKDGSVRVVVGTHALFQEQVEFENLGLIVADEQQRFGVRQRRALIEKGEQADFLMMSATPIPRTYAHFLFGDIALSSIHTMPPGRKPVETHFIHADGMKPILNDVLQGLDEGRQMYVVCPAIEENPETNVKAVEKIYQGMAKTFKDRYSVALLHGKMSQETKDQIMGEFSAGKIQILVSTTVIEVGIDVPNATMMVIYDAHRFGLSTLHQLRGRAARGKKQGLCYLLSSTKDPQAMDRLQKLEELMDGFSISEFDLKMRGPGDLLGIRQSGLPAFILGDFEKDPAIMECALEDAREIIARGIDLPILRQAQKAAENASYLD